MRRARGFGRDISGATAIEYALIVSLIGVGLTTTLGAMRTNVSGVLGAVASALRGDPGIAPPPPPAFSKAPDDNP